jgi:hypothetical protein
MLTHYVKPVTYIIYDTSTVTNKSYFYIQYQDLDQDLQLAVLEIRIWKLFLDPNPNKNKHSDLTRILIPITIFQMKNYCIELHQYSTLTRSIIQWIND